MDDKTMALFHELDSSIFAYRWAVDRYPLDDPEIGRAKERYSEAYSKVAERGLLYSFLTWRTREARLRGG